MDSYFIHTRSPNDSSVSSSGSSHQSSKRPRSSSSKRSKSQKERRSSKKKVKSAPKPDPEPEQPDVEITKPTKLYPLERIVFKAIDRFSNPPIWKYLVSWEDSFAEDVSDCAELVEKYWKQLSEGKDPYKEVLEDDQRLGKALFQLRTPQPIGCKQGFMDFDVEAVVGFEVNPATGVEQYKVRWAYSWVPASYITENQGDANFSQKYFEFATTDYVDRVYNALVERTKNAEKLNGGPLIRHVITAENSWEGPVPGQPELCWIPIFDPKDQETLREMRSVRRGTLMKDGETSSDHNAAAGPSAPRPNTSVSTQTSTTTVYPGSSPNQSCTVTHGQVVDAQPNSNLPLRPIPIRSQSINLQDLVINSTVNGDDDLLRGEQQEDDEPDDDVEEKEEEEDEAEGGDEEEEQEEQENQENEDEETEGNPEDGDEENQDGDDLENEEEEEEEAEDDDQNDDEENSDSDNDDDDSFSALKYVCSIVRD